MSDFIPNSFQVPNHIVDQVAGDISAKAFACLIFIIRKTRGWNKTIDAISMGQFKSFMGTKDKRTVYKIIEELEQWKLITVYRHMGLINRFELGEAFKSYPQPGAKNVGTKNVTSSKKCHRVGAKNVPGSSDKKCTSTKDNIKQLLQNGDGSKIKIQNDQFNPPTNDHELKDWAEYHQYSRPVSGKSWGEYRSKLWKEVRKRLARSDG